MHKPGLTKSEIKTWNFFVLPKYLFQHRIDIFHTQYILPLFAPHRTKIVVHIHDVSFRAYPELIGWSDRLFLALLIPRSLRRAALILAPSQFTKDEIVKYYGIDKEKIAVIPNAVGTDFLESHAPDPGEDSAIREKYHLPEHFILFVGTLQPRKNIPFLLEAFASLRQRLPHMKLVLASNRQGHHIDTRVDAMIRRFALEEAVVFPGFVDKEDLPRVIRMASVFAFPSLYEGFGIPLLEAMSQNVPVAASDIPSLREVAGDAALYFDPMTLASCEEKLYTLLIDQKQKEALIQRGKARLIAFSWDRSADLLRNEYNKLHVL